MLGRLLVLGDRLELGLGRVLESLVVLAAAEEAALLGRLVLDRLRDLVVLLAVRPGLGDNAPALGLGDVDLDALLGRIEDGLVFSRFIIVGLELVLDRLAAPEQSSPLGLVDWLVLRVRERRVVRSHGRLDLVDLDGIGDLVGRRGGLAAPRVLVVRRRELRIRGSGRARVLGIRVLRVRVLRVRVLRIRVRARRDCAGVRAIDEAVFPKGHGS